MKLAHLLSEKNLADEIVEIEIKGLAINSRDVRSDYLFAAIKGNINDGRNYIQQAIKQGAKLILTHKPDFPSKLDQDFQKKDSYYRLTHHIGSMLEIKEEVVYVYTENPRKLISEIAARYYQYQPDNIAAITGTNGKTSTVEFLRQIWKFGGYQSASIGTLGVCSSRFQQKLEHTTPNAIQLHEVLAQLKQKKITHLAFEASSHGLSQHRIDHVNIDIAGFTNLTQDHFDYHPDMEHYFKAKLTLFKDISSSKMPAVICIDDKWGRRLSQLLKQENRSVFTIGWSGEDIKICEVLPTSSTQQIEILYQGNRKKLILPLVGEFQVLNALMAAGIAIMLGMKPDDVFQSIEVLKGISGRIEHVDHTNNGAGIFIDFAHTPDGLDKVLRALRPHTREKLYLVFGCGGNRDPSKRAKMGKIADKLADCVFITDDNPRDEPADQIRKEILSSAPNAIEIADRKQAIYHAISLLQSGDNLVIAGKGHETVQIIGKKTIPFSDFNTVKEGLKDQEKEYSNPVITNKSFV